jgi:hypothetical protein
VSAVLTFTSPSAAEEPTPAVAEPSAAPILPRKTEAPPEPVPADPEPSRQLGRIDAEPTTPSPDPTDTTPTFPELRIDLTPRSGPPGTQVQVSGVGVWCYDSGEERVNSVRVAWTRGDDRWVRDRPSDGEGRIAVTLTVPAVEPGPIGVEVSCPNEGETRTEQFAVEPAPTTPTPSTPTSTPPMTSTPPTPIVESPFTPFWTTSPTPASPSIAATSSPTPTPTPKSRPSSAPPAALAPAAPPPPSTTPAPSLSPVAERAGVPPISKSELLPPFDRVSFAMPIMVLAAALAVLLIMLVAFPADIFNKTYESCRREIHRFLRLNKLGKLFSLPPWVQGLLLAGAAINLGMLLSSDEGPAAVVSGGAKGNLIAQTLALVVAVPLVMAAYTAPGELYLRRLRAAVMSVPIPALLFAVLCGLLSLWLELEPAYTYGLFAMFIVRRLTTQAAEGRPVAEEPPVPEAKKAHGVLLSALCLAGLIAAGYAGFTANAATAHSGVAGWGPVILDAICYWIVVLGAESLIFALLPIRFLDGRTLAGWSLWLWTLLQFGAGWFFWTVLQLKAQADPGKLDERAVPKAILFFAIFGVLSLAWWGYFRWPNRPTRRYGDNDAPPLDEIFRPQVAIRRYRDEVVLAGRGLARGWRWCADWRRRSAPLRRRVRGLLWAPLQEPATRAAYYFFSFVARVSQSVSEAASHAAARTRPE